MALVAAHAKSAIYQSRDVLRKAWQALRATLVPDATPYRPELHYMRGPGPRSREAGRAEVRAVPPTNGRRSTQTVCAREGTRGFPR